MVVRMKKSRTKKFTTTNHTPLPLQCKRSPISNLEKMILWDTRPPSSWSADFSKAAIPAPTTPLLIYLPVLARSMSLDLLTYFKDKDITQVHVAAAAAAKSRQLCLTLRPHRRQPTRLPCFWDSPGKNTGVGCHFLLQCMKVKSEDDVAQLCPTLSDPMDCSLPGSSIHGIFQARALEWGAIAFSVHVASNW